MKRQRLRKTESPTPIMKLGGRFRDSLTLVAGATAVLVVATSPAKADGDKPDLRIGTAAAAAAGPAKCRGIHILVGDIERTPVQADQTPPPVPSTPRRPNRDRLHHRVMKPA